MWLKTLQDNITLPNIVPDLRVPGFNEYHVALDSVTAGRRFYRILFWLPVMMGSVLVTLIVGRMMYDPIAGPLNTVIGWFGIAPVPWLADCRIAMFPIIPVDIWWSTAFIIMMLLTGLQSLPEEVNDAARVDGATEWQLFWRVTFPLLAPVSAADRRLFPSRRRLSYCSPSGRRRPAAGTVHPPWADHGGGEVSGAHRQQLQSQ
jgi:hypothetical protein